MAVRIRFLGGVGTVTGSSHLITTDKSQVLLDAGLFQGRRDESYSINTSFQFNPRKLDALILSHAHIDHCGNIPTLIKRGMRCRIYSTSATRDLAKLMLEDSGKIQEEDTRYVNKINRRLGLPLREALYTRKEALKVGSRFRAIPYGTRFCAAKDIFFTFFDAGHILGSSVIAVEIKEAEGKSVMLGYAVDLGRKNLPLLNDPVVPKGLDYLVLESTYGGRLHAPIGEAKEKLKEAVNRTIARKGKILIPAFTLERTQEIIFFLDELLKEKSIAPVPIYVDSPLALEITDLFSHHADYLDSETSRNMSRKEGPFESLSLRFIRTQEESKGLNNDKRPMIIIAGSGMCESGRILHHLKNNIEESRNSILVVGYMAKDTLGRKIVERSRFVRIFGVEHELNAEVIVINSFSGHADKNELCDFALAASPLKRVFLVHSDPEQAQALSDALNEKNIKNYIPSKREEILLS
ncbi:MAG: MBL fold metallo-hydrolase [Candidatus Omnitrophica bacterium]|nr:MBL fold metallo-hydrolase [Candidatus Omnitrophota bacterium]MDD5553326.1 MBL fold metallo-hydrolase [Candidatus Omnitrophota bacterium]